VPATVGQQAAKTIVGINGGDGQQKAPYSDLGGGFAPPRHSADTHPQHLSGPAL
jgi:hypothetical protein